MTNFIPRVGQRVRVRLDGRCTHERVDADDPTSAANPGHFPEEDGLIGTVLAWPLAVPPRDGHDIAVYFGRFLPVTRADGRLDTMQGSSYTPDELVPLISLVLALPSGMVAVFDDAAQQIDAYQGRLSEMVETILRDCPEDVTIAMVGRDPTSLVEISPSMLRRLAKAEKIDDLRPGKRRIGRAS